MNLLAIDTSTEKASVALAVGDVFYHAEQGNLREHAQFILPMVAGLLEQAGLTLAELDGLVVGRGPGSFTGLRIACSVVKGLAYPHDLPVYPVSGLAAIANEAFHSAVDLAPKTRVLALIDARMHEVYWNHYALNGECGEEQVMPIDQLTLPFDGPLILAGVGFETYLPDLSACIQERCLQTQVIFPQARAMIRLVRQGACPALSAADVMPVYVRNQVVQGGK